MRDGIYSDIDADVEAAVAKLVEQHGFEKVNEHLFDLLDKSDWPTVQRISNLAKNIANRQKRHRSTKRAKNRRSKMTAIERR